MTDAAHAARRGRAIVGALLRAHSRFQVAALAGVHPGLTGPARGRAVSVEQYRDSAYVLRVRARVARNATAAARKATDRADLDRRLDGIARRERATLDGHLDAAGRRIAVSAVLAGLRSAGHTHGVWVMNPTAEHCEFCASLNGQVLPLETIARIGPHTSVPDCAPGCRCRILSVEAARAQGIRVRKHDGGPLPDGAVPSHSPALRGAPADRLLEAAVLSATSGLMDLGSDLAGRVAARLREATVPAFDESKVHRWPIGHPWGGRFRRSVGIGDMPSALTGALKSMSKAATAGDAHGVDRAYDEMVRTAKQLASPEERDKALRAASRARAAVLNPRGERRPIGVLVDTASAGRRGVPIGSPNEGDYGPWSRAGTFLWELHPDELGPQGDAIIAALRRRKSVAVRDLDGGMVTLESAEHRSVVEANGDARRLEAELPQLRVTRSVSPGDDLADPSPIDIAPDEAPNAEDGKTWYPGVSTRQLGDAAENLVDVVGARMVDLGLLDPDDPVDLPSLRSRDRNAPLDWTMGPYGIEVKAQAMRAVTPGRKQRAHTVHARDQATKIAAIKRDDLQGAQVAALTDLDNDVGHYFFHAYPDAATAFKEIRLPMALVDGLMAGDLRPGQESIAQREQRGEKRWVYLGSFRLGYNPLIAADPDEMPSQADLEATRERATRHRPADIGAGRLALPRDAEPASIARAEAATARVSKREARDARIVALAGQGLSQPQIAEAVGLSQARVSQILDANGAQTDTSARRAAGELADTITLPPSPFGS